MRNIDDDHSNSYMNGIDDPEFESYGSDYPELDSRYFDFDSYYEDEYGFDDHVVLQATPTDKILRGESKKVKVLRSEVALYANRKVGKEVLRGFRRTDKNEAIRFATEEFIESPAFANVGKGVVSLRMKRHYNSLKSF
jgi:hypothetical protein